jgi:hypothetical protein
MQSPQRGDRLIPTFMQEPWQSAAHKLTFIGPICIHGVPATNTGGNQREK